MQSQSVSYFDKVFEYYYLNAQQNSTYPAVLFIHGILSSGQLFTHDLMPSMATEGFSVYSLTLRGHGSLKGKPSSQPFQDHIDDVAAFIEFVSLQEKKPVVVVGYSLGGLIAQHVCLRESIQSKLAGLALMASVPPQGFTQLNQTMWFDHPTLSMVLGQVMAFPHIALLNPYFRHVLMDALFATKPNQRQLDALFLELKAEDFRLFLQPHPIAVNSPLNFPVLVVGGREDKLVPASQVQATADFYGVEPVFFTPMGHAMPVEKEVTKFAAHLANWCRTL
ncbi:alpha/beta hydrolase [Photobacterium sp. DNB22_13_2]